MSEVLQVSFRVWAVQRSLPSGGKPCSSPLSSAKKKNYFTSSDPCHDMLGGGCDGCNCDYAGKNGEFENIDFRFRWLSDANEMGFGHNVPFLE